jgi:mono/diheme cytochrome c family protein
MVAGVLVAYAGYRWWEGALPESIRALFLGESPGLVALADTRWFLLWALTAALVLSAVFLLALPRLARLIPLVLVMVAAFSFFGAYERLREGARKPFLIHDFMFSNGVRVDEISRLNDEGILAKARWAARLPAEDPEVIGEQVFLAQCRSCHTIDGYQGVRKLLPDDPDMIMSVLYGLREQGEEYTGAKPGEVVDKSELFYPYMPPFVGTEEEMMALVEYLSGLVATETKVARAEGDAR